MPFTFSVPSGAHALHDGYTDLVYVMLPIWQAEFGLSYAAVGILRSLFSGTLAGFQIPSGLLAEKLGAARVLAAGTALAGCGYLLAGASAGLVMLAAALIVGGLGASTQHPLASTLVARAFGGARSIKALGTYNFAGDIGKMTVPVLAALLVTQMPWRPAVALLGACGFAAALAIIALMPRREADATAAATSVGAAASATPRRGFPLLLSIGVLDSGTRMPFSPSCRSSSRPRARASLASPSLTPAHGGAGGSSSAPLGARIGGSHVLLTADCDCGRHRRAAAAAARRRMRSAADRRRLNGTSSVLHGWCRRWSRRTASARASASSTPAPSGRARWRRSSMA